MNRNRLKFHRSRERNIPSNHRNRRCGGSDPHPRARPPSTCPPAVLHSSRVLQRSLNSASLCAPLSAQAYGSCEHDPGAATALVHTPAVRLSRGRAGVVIVPMSVADVHFIAKKALRAHRGNMPGGENTARL